MTEILRQLGRYELLRRIAAGGMGEIFLAKMRGTAGFEKRVIIKTILPHLAEEEEFITKFLDEGRIVVQLTHGNIVPVFDMGEQDGEHFIAMEYIPGRDLREIIKRLQVDGKIMPVEMALYLIGEVCKGLDYAHRKSDDEGNSLELVHRDVSPSNVLISREGDVKVIDFGIARATNKLSRTISGRIQGKFCYMSPEQASGKIVDARSDIFSTGVVLYELLTGMRPFEGDTDLESIDLVRKCEFDPPSTLNSLVPPEVDEIVLKAMEPDLEQRYQNIDQMQTAVLQYLYSNACAPTSQQVADFLGEIFPGGIERKELRSTTSSRSNSKQPAKMSLDDILGQELDMLAGDGPGHAEVAFTATAPSSKFDRKNHRTATLAHDVTPSEPTDLDEASERPDADALADQSSLVLDVGDAARDANRTAPGDDSTPGEAASSGEDEYKGEPQREDNEEEETAATSADKQEEDDDAEEDALENSAPLAQLTNDEPPRRTGLMIAGGITLAIVAIIVAIFAWSSRHGTVRIESDPSGARMIVDGALISGATTPHRLDLEPGPHTFTLEKEGHRRSQTFRLEVQAGRDHLLEGGTITLEASEEDKAREVLIKSSPPGALLTVDGQKVGATPQKIELGDDVRVIYARHEDCKEKNYLISKNFRHEEVTIELDCQLPEAPDMGSAPDQKQDAENATSTNTGPRKIRVTIRAYPEDATITIDDERNFTGLFSSRFERNDKFKVRVHKPGYRPIERLVMPGKLRTGNLSYRLEKIEMGCLDVRVFQPQIATLLIDNKQVGENISRLEAHPLSAGPHTVRAVNKKANKDESYKVEIEPGKACQDLTVFP